jgi:hypothetical protein
MSKFIWNLKLSIVMDGLLRYPFKNEGCGEEGHQQKDAKGTWEASMAVVGMRA